MSLYKRGKTWHTDFAVNGQRFRQSLETTDWRAAQAKEKELIAQASEGKLTPKAQQFARLGFAQAAEKNLSDRVPRLAKRSIQTERERLKPLCKYFGEIPLIRISPDSVREYVCVRSKAGASNKTINLEIGVLRAALKRAKRWHLFADEVRPLPVRRGIGRALSPDERTRLEMTAKAKPEWENARLAMVLALNTTMRSCEIKGLCWRDVDFLERTLTIRQSKTDAGRRIIPLNQEAWEAVIELYQRARQIGGSEGNHYAFPACENGKIDPAHAQRSWRSAWRSLRKAAGLPRLRFHDLRHHAITELSESQASDSTIMSIAGHVSREMLEHYSHVRLDAKRHAVDALSSVSKGKSYVTNHVTNGLEERQDPLASSTKDWSGREDLNLRPPGPEPGALPG